MCVAEPGPTSPPGDVRRAKIHGRCERQTGIAPFERLVHQIMRQALPLCRSGLLDHGQRLFYRGEACIKRLQERWPTIVPVHTPIHASWLNQIEIYFSIIQRKVLTPNDLRSLTQLKQRLLDFQQHYETVAQPFQWKFTRRDLAKLLSRLHNQPVTAQAA